MQSRLLSPPRPGERKACPQTKSHPWVPASQRERAPRACLTLLPGGPFSEQMKSRGGIRRTGLRWAAPLRISLRAHFPEPSAQGWDVLSDPKSCAHVLFSALEFLLFCLLLGSSTYPTGLAQAMHWVGHTGWAVQCQPSCKLSSIWAVTCATPTPK